MTTTMDQLRQDSARLKRIFAWLFGIGAFLIFSEITYMPLKALLFSVGTADFADAAGDLGLTALGALPAAALLGAVWQARRLFETFAGGEIFSGATGRSLTRLGDWLVISMALLFLFGPAGERHDPAFGFYMGTIVMLGCIGLAIRLFGRVVAMAAAIKHDNDQIV
ncbi:MAG: DUF2975 domain-containing protein [Sphingomonadales bacterium]|jgi:hypothetical protein